TTYLETLRHAHLDRGRHLANAIRLLLSEAEAKPALDERRLACRHLGEVERPPLVEPLGRSGRVRVTHVLGLLERLARIVDPHVLPPDVAVARDPEQIADQAAAAKARRACRISAPKFLHLLARRGRLLEARRQQWLDCAVTLVSRGEELRGLVQLLLGKWSNLDARHPAADDSVGRDAEATYRSRA